MIQLNKIYHGDCLKIMKYIPDNKIDLTVTSPPYDTLRNYNKSLTWNRNIWKAIIQELFRITKQGGVVVWVTGDATIRGNETGTSFMQALWAKKCGFNLYDTMIYFKFNRMPMNHRRYDQSFEYMFIFSKGIPKTFNPIMKQNITAGKIIRGNRRQNSGEELLPIHGIGKRIKKESIDINVWGFNTGWNHTYKEKFLKGHPAIFPEELAHDHILSWSNEDDIVLDPMMGSGTTCKMAMQLKRNFIGIEINKDYCNLANKRLKNLSRFL
jgi:site-specific DNA-methyltransferase (adenine-specific)